MQPVQQSLAIVPGTTYRDTVRLMQPVFAYRDVTAIAGAPAVLTVPAHGLVGDWPVWVRGVRGMQAINREPGTNPHRAKVVDADTLRINALSADGLQPQGGELIYRLPIDLAGASVAMVFEAGSEAFTLTLGSGLAAPSPGTITRELTPAQTALLVGGWTYRFDVTFSDGSVIRFFEGGQFSGGCACA